MGVLPGILGGARKALGGLYAGGKSVAGNAARAPGAFAGEVGAQALTGFSTKQLRADPMSFLPWALPAGMFGKEVVADPILGAMTGGDPMQEYQSGLDRAREMLVGNARRDAMRKAALQSAARLAATDPHLYNQVMAGRRLPQGARVFGGQPRIDLMEQLAYDMAQGRFQQPQPQDELSALLGG